jgi:hypothetical protein
MNKQKSLSLDICTTLLSNIAQFMEYIPIDSPIQLWTSVFLEFDFLFDKLTRVYTTMKSGATVNYDLTSILRIMMNILKVPYIANVRLVLDPFSKLLTFILQNGTFQLEHIIELCSLSNRTFTRVKTNSLFFFYNLQVYSHRIERNFYYQDVLLMFLLKPCFIDIHVRIKIYF